MDKEPINRAAEEKRGFYQLEESPAFQEDVEKLLNRDPVRAEGSPLERLILRILNNIKAVYKKAETMAANIGKPGGAAALDESGKVPMEQLHTLDYAPGSPYTADKVATYCEDGLLNTNGGDIETDGGSIYTGEGGNIHVGGRVVVSGEVRAEKIVANAAGEGIETNGGDINTSGGNIVAGKVFADGVEASGVIKTTSDIDANFVYAKKLNAEESVNAKSISGEKMYTLTAPTEETGVANKAYVDDKVKTFTVTLGTSWSGSGPYTQTATVSGLLASDNPIVDVVLSSATATAKAQRDAWALVDRITTAANSITAYAYDKKPTTAIPIQIKVMR